MSAQRRAGSAALDDHGEDSGSASSYDVLVGRGRRAALERSARAARRSAEEARPRGDLRGAREARARAGLPASSTARDAVASSRWPRAEADLLFNLTESYAGDDTMDMNVAAYLDLLGQPYTGAGPARALPRAGQGARQEDLRLPRHPHALLRDRRTRAARPLARHRVPADREAGVRGRLDRHRLRLGRRLDQGADGADRLHPRGVRLARR